MRIDIETTVNAPLDQVWSSWVTPDDIRQWNFASDDWECPDARIDLREGGTFSYRMAAKDRSMAFDFDGTFTSVTPKKHIEFVLGDERTVSVRFTETSNGVRVAESFDAENENSAELQRQGWQNILDNFRRHAESKKT